MNPVRVMIVEDSPTAAEHLRRIISGDPRLAVCASAGSGEQALRLLEDARPDVISLDIQLPGIGGLELARRVMSERPTPIVVVAAPLDSGDLSIRALEAGALSVVEKPPGPACNGFEEMAEQICTQLSIMSQVRVVRQRRNLIFLGRDGRAPASPTASAPGPYEVLAVTASTGGPPALSHLLTALGPDFPLPILLVQHISDSFLQGFASWLCQASPFEVQVVDAPQPLKPRTVYLARAGRHLCARPGAVWTESGPQVCLQRPSGTVLFQSVARGFGPRACGVLLSGMGEDGAKGLLALREAGGYTIAEDETTAVVYGMPAAAERAGAVRESLPLPAIARRLIELAAAARKAV